MNTLRGKNFLSIMDLSKAELEWLIDEALYLKHSWTAASVTTNC